jgi:hypothetical protein
MSGLKPLKLSERRKLELHLNSLHNFDCEISRIELSLSKDVMFIFAIYFQHKKLMSSLPYVQY